MEKLSLEWIWVVFLFASRKTVCADDRRRQLSKCDLRKLFSCCRCCHWWLHQYLTFHQNANSQNVDFVLWMHANSWELRILLWMLLNATQVHNDTCQQTKTNRLVCFDANTMCFICIASSTWKLMQNYAKCNRRTSTTANEQTSESHSYRCTWMRTHAIVCVLFLLWDGQKMKRKTSFPFRLKHVRCWADDIIHLIEGNWLISLNLPSRL